MGVRGLLTSIILQATYGQDWHQCCMSWQYVSLTSIRTSMLRELTICFTDLDIDINAAWVDYMFHWPWYWHRCCVSWLYVSLTLILTSMLRELTVCFTDLDIDINAAWVDYMFHWPWYWHQCCVSWLYVSLTPLPRTEQLDATVSCHHWPAIRNITWLQLCKWSTTIPITQKLSDEFILKILTGTYSNICMAVWLNRN